MLIRRPPLAAPKKRRIKCLAQHDKLSSPQFDIQIGTARRHPAKFMVCYYLQPQSSHVRMNVAQLKRQSSFGVPDMRTSFPRSNERGSIEAGLRPRRRAFRRGSHVRMNVAQLKLRPQFTNEMRLPLFPRSNERGSIEAPRATELVFIGYQGSHVRMNVAQLKQVAHAREPAPLETFPRSNERGSIEASSRRSGVC